MTEIEKLVKSAFYEITSVIDDFYRFDYIRRVDKLPEGSKVDKKSLLYQYEKDLMKVRDILMGISSSFSYMNMSILQIKRGDIHYLEEEHYTEYDLYRYHYYVYSHAVGTIHDLFFKLVALLCNLECHEGDKIIKWETIEGQLNKKGETRIIKLLKDFYTIIKIHKNKRNRASHDGLLTYRTLDNYHLTNIWTNLHRNNTENSKLQYIKGTNENKILLGETKREFVEELDNLWHKILGYTLSLYDILLPKLIGIIDVNLVDSYRQQLQDLNMDNINRLLLRNK